MFIWPGDEVAGRMYRHATGLAREVTQPARLVAQPACLVTQPAQRFEGDE
jgi:hypothetical protein